MILWIWVPLVLVTMLLAVALPSQYGSTATFQLKADHDDHAGGDTYLDRYISGLARTVLGSPELRVAMTSLAPYPRLKDDPGAASKKLREDVDVVMTTEKILDPMTGLERKVNTGFTVTYTNPDPKTAQRVAAWLANAFLRDSRRAAAKALDESHFYADEAERQRAKVTQAEDSLAQFSQGNFDLSPDAVQETRRVYSSMEQELESVARDLRSQQQQRTLVQLQLQQARGAAGVNTDALQTLDDEYHKKVAVYGPYHPDVIALRKRIDAMRAGNVTAAGTSSNLEAQLKQEQEHLADLRLHYSEEHPDVKSLERTIEDMKTRIAAREKTQGDGAGQTPAVVLLQVQLNGLETQIDALEQQRAELRDNEEKLQSRLQKAPEVERTYDTLKRGVETARQLYEQLNRKRADAELRAAVIKSGTEDLFALEGPPLLPKAPTKPPRIAIALIGLIGATFLALMAALAAIALDRSVRGSPDLAMLLSLTPIAVVPLIRNAAFLRRRNQRLTALTATTLIAVPVLYLVIRFAVR